MASGFWFEKNVFITGINGFIGGNLAKALTQAGANVFGLVRNHTEESFISYEGLKGGIGVFYGELTDSELIKRVLSEQQINVIFHLAAQVEVGVGLRNPYLTFETNVRGTYTLMDAVRSMPQTIEAVVVASTDKSYGSYPKEKMPYKEDYPLLPNYPYDVSKACADMISQCYANDYYKLPIVVTRFCNIFGPGQLNFSAIVPDGTRSALGYTEFIPRGDGSQIRDFIYVGDVVSLYLSIGEQLATEPEKFRGEVFNAGTNSPISVREILEKIYQTIGNENDLKKVLKAMEGKKTTGEINCQYMDFEKVNHYFGWSPSHSFEQGLAKTIEWYRGFLESKYESAAKTS